MKGKYFKDKDLRVVTLPRGVYSIEGKIVEVSNREDDVQVPNFYCVVPITRTSVIHHYVNGDSTKSVEDYKSNQLTLLKNRIVDENGDYHWTTLEDEFTYRKFSASWTPVNNTIEVCDDPIKFAIEESTVDTGNKFVSSCYINGTSTNSVLFQYDRYAAVLEIVADTFKSLGMDYAGNVGYEATKNAKIWGNSTHSCVAYVTAFGKYILGKSWDIIRGARKGTLESMLAAYESDKETLQNIIRTKYNETFGNIDENKFNFSLLLNTLRNCKRNIAVIDPKQKSRSNYYKAMKLAEEAITQIEQSYE